MVVQYQVVEYRIVLLAVIGWWYLVNERASKIDKREEMYDITYYNSTYLVRCILLTATTF